VLAVVALALLGEATAQAEPAELRRQLARDGEEPGVLEGPGMSSRPRSVDSASGSDSVTSGHRVSPVSFAIGDAPRIYVGGSA